MGRIGCVFNKLCLVAILCFTVLLASPQSVFADEGRAATERIFEQKSPSGQTTYVTVRGENELWIIEAFARTSDGWQDRIWRKSYRTLSEAQSLLKPMRLVERPMALLEKAPELRGPRAGEVLWKVTQNWDWQWEERYADWVMKNADPEFFQHYQIATDCADVAYSMRWIFARIHGLPVAAKLAGSGNLLTQDSVRSEWLRYPTAANWWEDKRFMKAIDYLMNNTYTHTLVRDSYPIEISKSALVAGTHFLRLFGKTGHTQYVHRTFYNDPTALPLKLMASTVPRSVRSLFETDFWEVAPPVEGEGGFMHFRWPVRTSRGTTVVAPEQMPYYSLAQFKPEFMNGQQYFAMAVLGALNPGFSLEKWLQAGVTDIKTQLVARKAVVEQGAAICAAKSCAPGTAEYEDWSTPSRDKRLGQLLTQLESVTHVPDYSDILRPLWEKALKDPAFELNGTTYPLNAVVFIWKDQMFSSEPTVSMARRWGFEPNGFAENFAERMTSLLSEREKKITGQGRACSSTTCAADSEEWAKWQTFNEDIQLVRLRYLDRSYCETIPNFCSQYQGFRDSVVIRFGAQPEKLATWLDRVIWLNSDPNQSKDVRWGSMRTKFRSYVAPSNEESFVTHAGWIMIGSNKSLGETKIANVETGLELPPPKGFKWFTLSSSGEWAISNSLQENEVAIRNLATGTETRFPFHMKSRGFAPMFVLDLVLIPDETGAVLHIVKLNGTPIPLGDIQDFESFGRGSIEGVVFVKSTSKTGAIYDLRNGVLRFDLPAEAGAANARNVNIDFETDRFLLIETCASWTSCQAFSLEKKTGAWKKRPHLDMTVLLAGSNHAFRHEIDSVQQSLNALLVQVDDDLNLVSSKRIGTFVEYKAPYACVGDRGSMKTVCYPAGPNGYDPRPVFTDRNVEAWDAEFIAWARGSEDGNHLSPVSNPNQVLLSAKAIRSANGASPGWFTAYNGGNYQYRRLVDTKMPGEGSVVTFSNGPRSEAMGSLFRRASANIRGVTIELPSEETLWLERK